MRREIKTFFLVGLFIPFNKSICCSNSLQIFITIIQALSDIKK